MTKQQRKKYNAFIIETVETLKSKNEFSWQRVAEEVFRKYPNVSISKEGIRSTYRYQVNQANYRDKQLKEKTKKKFLREGTSKFEERFIQLIRYKHEINNLTKRLGISFEQLLTEITKLELKGIIINKWKENGKSYIQIDKDKKFQRDMNTLNLEAESQIKFLVIGDTHIGHKLSNHIFLNEVIQNAYDKGVRIIFHTGDIVEGHYQSIRPTSIRELNAIGFDEQIEMAEEVFPKLEGLTYYAITGNHDATFDRNAFANPGKILSKLRNDFKYLGHNFAKITINDKIDIVLNHPIDGIGENYALKLKQYIDRNTEERLGRFIFMGHYHKYAHLHYMGIDAWVTPSFIGQTEFMSSKNLESVIGAILMTINLDDEGNIVTFTPEYYFLD